MTYPEHVHAQQHLLADVAARIAAGTGDPAELHAAFLIARVYCEGGEAVGFRALGSPGAGVIPVYTSVEQLSLARGTVPWFATTGRDLLDLLPPGYDVLLDPAGLAPLRLRPSVLSSRIVVDVQSGAA